MKSYHLGDGIKISFTRWKGFGEGWLLRNANVLNTTELAKVVNILLHVFNHTFKKFLKR